MINICRFTFIQIEICSYSNVNILEKVPWNVPVEGWKNI